MCICISTITHPIPRSSAHYLFFLFCSISLSVAFVPFVGFIARRLDKHTQSTAQAGLQIQIQKRIQILRTLRIFWLLVGWEDTQKVWYIIASCLLLFHKISPRVVNTWVACRPGCPSWWPAQKHETLWLIAKDKSILAELRFGLWFAVDLVARKSWIIQFPFRIRVRSPWPASNFPSICVSFGFDNLISGPWQSAISCWSTYGPFIMYLLNH